MRHGTEGAYRAGCRCEACRARKRRSNAEYRAARIRRESERARRERVDALLDAAGPRTVRIHGVGDVRI